MANRPFLPMTAKWASEFITPHGPGKVPQPGMPAPDFELPYAQFIGDPTSGEGRVEYGRTLRLSSLRGQPVVLNLTRIVSDRFF